MFLIKYGFSIEDIDKIENEYYIKDYYTILDILKEEKKNENKVKDIERYVNILNTCDAVLHANAYFHNTKKFKGFNMYRRWWNGIKSKINKLIGIKQPTIWDRMKRLKKKSNRI